MAEMTKTQRDVLIEARKRFERCKEWYGEANRRWLEDYKFANGDSYNMWQWPQEIYKYRQDNNAPALTVNKVRQHNLMIINDAKQNKPGITVRPVGNGATFEAAQVLEGICRHIEYQSNATATYDSATSFQVQAGVGYWRVITDYVDEMSFEQEIYIRPIADPLGVYIDPDCKARDKSDAEFAFIFEDISREKFERDFPEYEGMFGQATLDNTSSDWIGKDHIRRCEYYRKVVKEDWLIEGEIPSPDGSSSPTKTTALGKMLTPNVLRDLLADEKINRRRTTTTVIEWKYIVGDKIIDEKVWLGSSIPIVEVLGEETIIDGRYDRKGHTRALMDPQRMYNYSSSSAIEYGALQTKVPWITPIAAVEGYTQYWDTANRKPWAYLPYQHMDDTGNPIPPPTRAEPPVPSPFFASAMQTSQMEMMMASGQYEAQMGQQGNERSAKAIGERQRQADNATYHYVDNQGVAIRRTGEIILDLIPKVYDTERVLMILAENGDSIEVKVDPQAKMAFMMRVLENNQVAERILNPNVGKYEVRADVGPGYATQRQEAFDAFTMLLTQAPQIATVIGDLLFKAGDFPLADEAAERLRRMVPQQALGTGPSQNEQQMTAQIEQMKGVMTEMLNELARKELELKDKAADATTDSYRAETDRLKVVSDHTADILKVRDMVNEMVAQMQEEKARDAGSSESSSPSSPETPTDINARLNMRYGGQG